MHVHLNGRLTPADTACIAPNDRGLTLGDGLFETIAIRAGQVRRLEVHLARLRRGLALLGFALPHDETEIARFLAETIQANAVETGAARLTLTRGPAPRGLPPPDKVSPTLLIAAAAGAPRREAVSAIVASVTRRNEHSPLSRIKALPYLDNVLAAQEAKARGAGAALLLNGQGRLAGADSANLFAVIDGCLVTPPADDGALEGTVRAEILAQHGGQEAALLPDDLWRAEEAFLSNALGIRPLIALDGAPLGNGRPGKTTAALAAIFA